MYGWTVPPPAVPDLLPQPPKTVKEAEDRVSLVRDRLTNGEKHLLYRLLHDVEGIRLDACDYEVAKMRKELGGKS